MGLKRLFFGFIIVSLMTTGLAGCTVQSEPAAIQLVPEGASFLGQVQVRQIINDQDLTNAYNRAEKEQNEFKTVDDALKTVVEGTGLDLRNFSQAIIFGDVNKLEQVSYLGLIAEGTFDEAEFMSSTAYKSIVKTPTGDYMEEKFTTSEYKGYRLHTADSYQKSGIAIAFLSNKVLLYGSTKAVQDIIDVRKGDRKSVSGVILETYNQLGDSMVRFASNIPETARESLKKESVPGSPISFRVFANMDLFGFAFDKESANVTVKMNAHFLDVTSAEDARDTLGVAITLFKGLLTVPEVKNLLGKIQVTAQDTWVGISLVTTVSELENLVETLSEITQTNKEGEITQWPNPPQIVIDQNKETPQTHQEGEIMQWPNPPQMAIDQNKEYEAIIKTDFGDIIVQLFPKDAPIAVNNFVFLSNNGFFNGVKFHRVIKGFVIQSGDPTGTGSGGPGYKFADEKVTRDYIAGTLAMANAGPNTNGSQFFITLTDLSNRLPKNYTIFGLVIGGFDIVEKIGNVPVNRSPSGELSSPTEDVHIDSVIVYTK